VVEVDQVEEEMIMLVEVVAVPGDYYRALSVLRLDMNMILRLEQEEQCQLEQVDLLLLVILDQVHNSIH
jgi:hypothetical protein